MPIAGEKAYDDGHSDGMVQAPFRKPASILTIRTLVMAQSPKPSCGDDHACHMAHHTGFIPGYTPGGGGVTAMAAGRLQILHVIPSVSNVHGGPSRALVIMEQALIAAGVGVMTATTDDDGPDRRLTPSRIEREHNGAERFYARKWLDLYKVAPGMVPWLWHSLPKFDVVHIHALFSFTSVTASLIARLHNVPYIVRPLGTLAPYGMTKRRPWLKKVSLRILEGPILRHAAAVHFTSRAEWEQAMALGIPFRGRLIPLGVETSGVKPDGNPKHSFPGANGRRGVLYLGRLDPKKNIEALLRATTLVEWGATGAVLLIAGDGDPIYVAELKRLAATLGIEDHVLWLGHVEGARKAAAFAAADVFVLPSFSENFGIAAVEAMLAGLPCVLSPGVAIAGDAARAGGAVLVEPEPQALAMAIDATLHSEGARKAMGDRAREFALGAYSTSAMARRLIDLYESVASPKGPHTA
jgi:glycosyltransferase involved in cell wall biosynthesis